MGGVFLMSEVDAPWLTGDTDAPWPVSQGQGTHHHHAVPARCAVRPDKLQGCLAQKKSLTPLGTP